MGSCTRRHFLLSTCFLQMITIIERQAFDFLGYMWAPIFVNFFQILFIIFGFYGAYHFRIKYIINYLLWSILWIGWNSFLICFYLNVGELDKDSDLLNLGTGSVSWFEINGYGCKPTYPTNITSDDPFRPIRPERVDDCLLEYPMIEVIHSGIQCALAFIGILGAILISYIFLDEDDRLKHINKKTKHCQSLYSIEFGPSIDTIRSRTDTILDYDDQLDERNGGEISPKPMTPRRVKRRSVMARGSNIRSSTTSRRSYQSNNRDSGGNYSTNTHSRSSMRNSRRKYQQNQVTKLLDKQQQQLQIQIGHQHHHQHHNHHQKSHQQQSNQGGIGSNPQFGSFHHKENPTLTASNLQSLHQEILNKSFSNIPVTGGSVSGSLTKSQNNNNNNLNQSIRMNIAPDPIYYNTKSQAGGLSLQEQSWQSSSQSQIIGSGGGGDVLSDEPASPTVPMGHFNPTYQHSTNNLNDGEYVDDLYNNRPPSVRSSYSNFHGTRPLSSYLPRTATENVFVGLTGAQQHHQEQLQQQQQYNQHQKSLYHHQHPPSHSPTQSLPSPLPPPPPPITPPQNIPFAKRTASRESIRSMAFLNSGPPAYNLNYHTPPDSETTM